MKKTSPLKENWTYHVNPDGTKGGQVFKGATVDPSAYIGPTAVILSGAIIGPNAHVRNGSIISKSGEEIRFD